MTELTGSIDSCCCDHIIEHRFGSYLGLTLRYLFFSRIPNDVSIYVVVT